MNITFEGFGSLKDIPLRMTIREARELKRKHGEYSASYPTLVIPGKKWLRHDGAHDPQCAPLDRRWMLCQYGPTYINKRGVEVCEVQMIAIEFVDEAGNVLPHPQELRY
jgi:hypothetical protein